MRVCATGWAPHACRCSHACMCLGQKLGCGCTGWLGCGGRKTHCGERARLTVACACLHMHAGDDGGSAAGRAAHRKRGGRRSRALLGWVPHSRCWLSPCLSHVPPNPPHRLIAPQRTLRSWGLICTPAPVSLACLAFARSLPPEFHSASLSEGADLLAEYLAWVQSGTPHALVSICQARAWSGGTRVAVAATLMWRELWRARGACSTGSPTCARTQLPTTHCHPTDLHAGV